MLVAEICVNLTAKSIWQVYTYSVPEKFKFIVRGWRVIVPFGSQIVDGFIMEVKDTDETFDFKLKEILEVVDDEIWFTPQMLSMASWISDFYLCPLSQAMSLFMAGRHSQKIAPKIEKILRLNGTFEESDFKRAPKQLEILKRLSEVEEIPASEFSGRSAAINSLVKKNLIIVEERRILRDSYAAISATQKNIELTEDQKKVVENISFYLKLKMHAKFLLHGVTGSGKTQIYIELTKIIRQLGRRVLILVPEISLTGQIVKNFKAHFSDVLVIHSKLSIAERNDIF